MGRPTKLTPDAQKTIVNALEVGCTYLLAAQSAGVNYTTFNEWMKQGEAAQSGKFSEFYHAVKKAEGNRAARWLQRIEQAATDGQWQAAAWKLERIYPDDYGKRERLDVAHSGNINVSTLSDEELQAIVASSSGGGT